MVGRRQQSLRLSHGTFLSLEIADRYTDVPPVGAIGLAWTNPTTIDAKLEGALRAVAELRTATIEHAERHDADRRFIVELSVSLLGKPLLSWPAWRPPLDTCRPNATGAATTMSAMISPLVRHLDSAILLQGGIVVTVGVAGTRLARRATRPDRRARVRRPSS